MVCVQDVRCRVSGTGQRFHVPCPWFRLASLGLWVEDVVGDSPPVWELDSRVHGTRFRGCRVHGTRFRVSGVGFRVSDSGCRVLGVDLIMTVFTKHTGSIHEKHSGSMKVTTHLDHIRHCKAPSGTSWSNTRTFRVFIINTRSYEITRQSLFRAVVDGDTSLIINCAPIGDTARP